MAKSALVREGRIVQIEDANNKFEVAEGFEWIDVPDDTTTQDHYIDGVIEKPAPVKAPSPAATLDDVIAVLTAEQKAVIQKRLSERNR